MQEAAAKGRHGRWLCAVIAVVAACDGRMESVPAARPQVPAAAAPVDIPALLGRTAVNVLVLPLLDDAEPPRFTTVALPFLCGEASEVSIDGLPMVEGAEVPAGSFLVHWRLRGYCPFGNAGPELDGDLDVLVLRDDDAGLQALLLPARRSQLARGAR